MSFETGSELDRIAPGRELDAIVHEYLGRPPTDDLPAYSDSWLVAGLAVEIMAGLGWLPSVGLERSVVHGGYWTAWMGHEKLDAGYGASTISGPHAIALAVEDACRCNAEPMRQMKEKNGESII